MFCRWISESGVSRGTSSSFRPSFSATDAARWIRFDIAPEAIVPSVPIEHGQMTYASTFAEPPTRRGEGPARPPPRRPARRGPPPVLRVVQRHRRPRRLDEAGERLVGREPRVAVELGGDHLDPRPGRAHADLAPRVREGLQ